MPENFDYDVAVIGGGPVGSTVGTLLKKYNPALSVGIFEREKFPRDHVGESLLPVVTRILDEMGVWDAIEAADFPIKLGAVYRWGRLSNSEPFHFHFLDSSDFHETARPGKFVGQRTNTAFQVDRAIYDDILLKHAAKLGCEVFEETNVASIERKGDKVESLQVSNAAGARRVTAKYYVDASGSESLLRKSMEVATQYPTLLRNIAIWDYWQNAEWAEKIGVGGTYVYVMSLGYGWIWFIPLGPTRTSIGLVTSAEYYRSCGLSKEELYAKALAEEPLIQKLTANATSEDRLQATKDWNFIADRLYGENWFLAGDAGGFADPILAAGLTLAQTAGRRVAYSILELERGKLDPNWIKQQYEIRQRKNTLNHMRFAEYWYSANGHFTDLKEYCTTLAKEAGLTLNANQAFQWLGTGGFSDEMEGVALSGAFSVTAVKGFTEKFGGGEMAEWTFKKNNVFKLNLEGATEEKRALYGGGTIREIKNFKRGDSNLPLFGFYASVYRALQRDSDIQALAEWFIYETRIEGIPPSSNVAHQCLEILEALVADGWVKASYDPSKPLLEVGVEAKPIS